MKQEIKSHFRLKHPNICRLYEVIDTVRYVYLIMEFIEGKSLQQILNERPDRRLEESECRFIFKQLLIGVEHMHEKNIVH